MKRETLRAVAVLVLVFLLGAVAGVGGAVAFRRHRYRPLHGEPRRELEEFRLRALSRALDLTAAQSEQVRTLLERNRAERRAAWDTVMTQCGEPLKKSKEALDESIRGVLTPEQRARFDVIAQRQKEHFFGAPPPPK